MRLNRKKYEQVFGVFLWLYILANTTLYIGDIWMYRGVEVIALIGMLLCTILACNIKGIRVNCLVLMYGLAVMCCIIPDVIDGNIEYVSSGINLLLPVFILMLMNNIYSNMDSVPSMLINIPLVYGSIVAIQSLILQVLTVAGVNLVGHYESIEKNAGQLRYIYPYFLGIQSTIFHVGEVDILRLNGYYLEPAKFAFFLIIPTIIGFYLFKETRKKRYLCTAIVCGIALFFTFSRAGYISMICAIGLSCLWKKNSSSFKVKAAPKDWMKMIGIAFGVLGIILILMIIGAYFANQDADNYLLKQFTWQENGKVTLIRTESSSLLDIFRQIIEKPYGYGMGVLDHSIEKKGDYNVANAFSFWLYAGGVLGVIFILGIFVKVISRYVIPLLSNKQGIGKAYATIFVALTIFSLSYGNWITVDYMYILGMMILVYNINRDNKVKKKEL